MLDTLDRVYSEFTSEFIQLEYFHIKECISSLFKILNID